MGFKIDDKILDFLEDIRYKEALTYEELSKAIGIGRATFYRIKEDKKASPLTFRKLKTFLKKHGYKSSHPDD